MNVSGPMEFVLLDTSAALPARFDAGSSGPRLLLLVSPTCPLCLAGIELVLHGLEEPPGERFDVHVVWLPVLDGDAIDAAAGAAMSIGPRPRMTHYWDVDRAISSAAHGILDLTRRRRRVAWDLYLLYRAGVTWSAPLPSPDVWLHQLDIADQPSLDAATLRAAFEELTFERASKLVGDE